MRTPESLSLTPEVPHQAPAASEVVAGLDELADRLNEHSDTIDQAAQDVAAERELAAVELAAQTDQKDAP